MTNMTTQHQAGADAFGHRVAMRLAAGTNELPYEVRERLRAARSQAVARRKVTAAAPVVVGRGAGATLALGEEFSLWTRIGSALPIIALAAGLIALHSIQADHRASEVAEVDTALLTDDLPPAAFADPGFVQFLRSGHD